MFAFLEPKDLVHHLKGYEEGSQQAVGEVCEYCWCTLFEHTVADELRDPADGVDQAHKPELAHSKVVGVLVGAPNSIAKDHRRPHPHSYGKRHPPIDDKVWGTESYKWCEATSDFVAHNRILLTELNVGRDAT